MLWRCAGLASSIVLSGFVAFSISPAFADKRVALVIGNNNYVSLRQLKNPTSDAHDIAGVLKDIGFDVEEKDDLSQAEMLDVLRDFAAKSTDADLSVLYYAGHGLQLSSRNYLIPVDATLESEDDIRNNTIDFNDVLDELASGSGAHIIFLDACRSNPIQDYTDNGLAPPTLPKDFLIAYSAAPGQVAYDGGGRNSPFASALLRYLPEKGKDVSVALMSTRRDVLLNTGTKQLPTDWSTLSQEVVFAPGESEQFPPETQLWQLAATQKDADLLRVYLARYPDGPHVADAEALRGTLGERPPTPEPKDERVESLLWSLAKNERMRPLVELYLARFPEGTYAAEATSLLASLPSDEEASPDEQCQRLATHPSDAAGSIRGVPGAILAEHRDAAIKACRAAVAAFPDNPHYLALLARSLASGRAPGETVPAEAVTLYRQAAERGDARAMISLGLLEQNGDGVPKDLAGAAKLYEQAANAGHPDGAVQFATALWRGAGVKKDTLRAVDLLKQASAAGSAMATHNLGVFYSEGVAGTPADALPLFERAAELGYPQAYVSAAILLDEGRGVERDSKGAADFLLKAVATDAGDAFDQITTNSASWSRDTIEEIQSQLKAAGYYSGPVDGKSGPKFAAALNQWRLLGPPPNS